MKFCSPNNQHAAGFSSMSVILCSTYLAIVQRGFARPRVHRCVKGDNTFKIRVYYSRSGKKNNKLMFFPFPFFSGNSEHFHYVGAQFSQDRGLREGLCGERQAKALAGSV